MLPFIIKEKGGDTKMILKSYPLKILEKKYKEEVNGKVKQRIQILIQLREGNSQREVSHMVRVSVGSVPFWKKRFEKEGFMGLRDKEGRGLKPRLTKDQLADLEKAVEDGVTMQNGYKRGMKTKDVITLIREKFRITYTARHCRRILRKLDFRLKVPRPRHKRRNQNSVEEFKEEFKKNLQVWMKTPL